MAYQISETVSFFIPSAFTQRGARQDLRDVGIYLSNAFATIAGRDAKSADTLRTAAWPQTVEANTFGRRPNMHEWWEAAKTSEGAYAITHYKDDVAVAFGLGAFDVLVETEVAKLPSVSEAKAFLAAQEDVATQAMNVLDISYRPAMPWNHFRHA